MTATTTSPAPFHYVRHPINTFQYQDKQPLPAPLLRTTSRPVDARKRRVFVESSDGEFFGLNTTVFRTEGLLGGLYKKVTNYYDNTAQDYLAGVYSDALDDYFGGLVQLVGWFVFGSLMVLINTGTLIIHLLII